MKIKNAKVIRQQMNAKVKDLGEGQLEAIVSTDELDRHGEVVSIDGIDLKNYKNNPVVLWAHDSHTPPVGKTLKLVKDKVGKKSVLKATLEFAVGISDLASEVYELYKGGFMHAFSIGFIPEEMEGNIYTKSELLEYSAVPIPANPGALALAKSKGLDISNIIKYTGVMNIKELLKKEVGDLTVSEIKFLKENLSELSAKDKEKFASVLEEKDVDFKAALSEGLTKMKDELKEDLIKELDGVSAKDINDKTTDKNINPTDDKEYSKEELFKLYVVGLSKGDLGEYKDAMNTSDDSALLPPTEFIAEVERLEEEYGVARKDASFRRSTKASLTLLLGDDDLDVYDTNEAGAKTSTKLSYETIEILWRKFAGILPITDELEEESAIDLWNDATARFARAFTKKQDMMVFTETSAVSPKNQGILSVSGVNVVELTGDSFEDLDYDTLSKMIWGVPTPSERSGKFYLNREILGVVQRIKDTTGRPVWQRAMADGTPSTILGKAYELVEVMPALSDDAAETKFLVFGNLKYVTLGERTGMQIKIFDSGNVTDPDDTETELNLLTQDMKAMRAVKRMNSKVRFPAAFSVAKTAASAS